MAKYPYKSIASILSLSNFLDIAETELIEIAKNANSYYFVAKEEPKSNGSVRITYDAELKLKDIHEKIKVKIFQSVQYPAHLQGGIKGRDYISNTKIHAGRKFLITEDISNFFPSISAEIVRDLWLYFFKFSHEVSDILTKLTTLNGFVPQGAKTSGYIANLILWDKEDFLIESLKKKGMSYSRLVDDITVSCNYRPSPRIKSTVISEIYGILLSKNVKPNRKKHKMMPAGNKQKIHNLNVNTGNPTLPKTKRSNIRAAVYQCEKMAKISRKTNEYKKLFNSVSGQVAMFKRLHATQATLLKIRLDAIKPKTT